MEAISGEEYTLGKTIRSTCCVLMMLSLSDKPLKCHSYSAGSQTMYACKVILGDIKVIELVISLITCTLLVMCLDVCVFEHGFRKKHKN